MNNRSLFISFLVLSLSFIIPLNIGSAFANNVPIQSGDYVENQQFQNVCGGNSLSNVKNSLVMSVMTMCLPGILEKTDDWRNNKCQKVVCKYDAVKNGLDPTFCEKQAAYQTCSYIVGEAFALPGFSFVENLRNAVAELLQNPVGYLWSRFAQAARTTLDECSTSGSCSSLFVAPTAIFLAFTDIAGVVQTFKDIRDNGFNPRVDYCDQLDDIKSELEEIVEVRG